MQNLLNNTSNSHHQKHKSLAGPPLNQNYDDFTNADQDRYYQSQINAAKNSQTPQVNNYRAKNEFSNTQPNALGHGMRHSQDIPIYSDMMATGKQST